MALLYTTGPAHIFVGINSAGGALARYLGTCEEAPEIDIDPKYIGVKNAIGGTEVPFDLSYQGEHAFLSFDLNRYNEPVYAALANRPRTLLAPNNTARGSNTAADVGTLVLTEGFQVVTWVLFQFGASGQAPKGVFTSNGMPAGYRFLATVPFGPDKLRNLGTKPRRINLMMYAIRSWNPQTLAFSLYDHNMAGLPPIN